MKPKVMETREGVFRCDTAPALLLGRSLSATGASAILPLQNLLRSRFQSTASADAPGTQLPTSPYILIGLASDHPALRQLVSDHKAALPKHGLGPEGYILDVSPARILLAASKPAGVFYGVQELMELDTATGSGLAVPAGVLVDWPEMPWRGIHLLFGSRASLPDLEKILTDAMPRYRLNQIVLQVDYHYKFKSHPEMTDGDALTREDCRHLKQLADQNSIRLIPMIDCLGHQSWAEQTGQLLKAHPDFDETPDYPADNKGIYCRSWCPSNPDVDRLVFDLIDELIDAFDADAFHVGMDEVFILGKCPRCKDMDNATLFAKAVNDLHAHIAGQRKRQMLMWADRLLDGKATGYGEWEASENGTAPAIDRIPKDIVLCDWHYETRYNDAPATYPSVHYFQEKGFRVWPSAWNSEENARLLAAASLQNRTDRMVGYLATTWAGIPILANGLSASGAPPGAGAGAGVVAAIKMGARIAWEGSAGTP